MQRIFKQFNFYILQMELTNLDPDWEAAQLHGLSTMPGMHKQSKSSVCLCCLNKIDKGRIPLCQNSKELEFLGFGFPLFYIFIKYCIILLFISVSSYNAIAIYRAITNNEEVCLNLPNGCTSFMVKYAQISPTLESQELVTRIFSFIIHLVILFYIRDIIAKTRSYYDERKCSLSDYSIMITNLPKVKGMKQKLIHFLKTSLDKPYQPYQITLLPQSQEFYILQQQKYQIIQSIKPLIVQEELNYEKILQLENQLIKRQSQIKQYCKKYITLEQNDECITQKLLFSCWTEDQKIQILSQCQDISGQRLSKAFFVSPDQQCNIQFVEAPQPKQIKWENINYPDHKRIARIIIGWIITIIFLMLITVVFFLFLLEKTELMSKSFDQTQEQQYYIGLIITYLAVFCLIIFNKFFMAYVLHKICWFQRHSTTDEQQYHFAIKYLVGMFFTTSIMTLTVKDMQYNHFYDHSFGLIEEQTVIHIMNALSVPILFFINPQHIYVVIKRKLYLGKKNLTQKQANKLMENVQYNLGKKYAYVIQTMWLTFFYTSLIPIGAFLSIIGLSCYYWVDKYNLLRKSSLSSSISGQLSHFSMKLLDFTLFWKPVGQLIFDQQIRQSYSITSIIMCAIAIVYLFLPIDDFLNYFHPERFKTMQKNFSAAQKLIKNNYQTLHPILSLKKENKQKIFKSLLCDKDDNDITMSIKRQSNLMQVQQVHGGRLVTSNPLIDATIVLKDLIRKHEEFVQQQKIKIINDLLF